MLSWKNDEENIYVSSSHAAHHLKILLTHIQSILQEEGKNKAMTMNKIGDLEIMILLHLTSCKDFHLSWLSTR
jgi:hypothetical protein